MEKRRDSKGVEGKKGGLQREKQVEEEEKRKGRKRGKGGGVRDGVVGRCT